MINLNNSLKAIVCMMFLALLSFQGFSKTTISTGTGTWSTMTWSNGIPADGDYVIIATEVSVDVAPTPRLHGVRVKSGALLTINNSKTLMMEATPAYIIVEEGGVISFLHKTQGTIEWTGGQVLNGSPSPSSVGRTITGPSYSSGMADFSEWDNALPVTLISFSGRETSNAIVLTWESAKESDHGYYNVQRSTDGVNFESIAHVAPQSNPGIRSYQYTDKMTLNGNVYYRLEMVGSDGESAFSNIIKTTQSSGMNTIDISLYPNPTKSVLNIKSIERNISYAVIDMAGRICQTGTLSLGQQSINTNDIIPGNYMIRIQDAVNTTMLHFTKE